MSRLNASRIAAALAMCAASLFAVPADAGSRNDPLLLTLSNPTGISATYSTNGPIDSSNPFFQKLGMNGRSCDTCHQPADGWTVSVAGVRARFEASAGNDPIFRLVDGANSPLADVSTVDARRSAYSMLLERGVFRVGIPMPSEAEFTLDEVRDPYGYASAAQLSLFRRPLPATNLKFHTAVMWDGRETFLDPTSPNCILNTTKCYSTLEVSLLNQANDATLGHAQAAQALTTAQRSAIVSFEMGLETAQLFDNAAKYLDAQGAEGGPLTIASQDFYFGINDVVDGDYKTGNPFDPRVFRIYDAWTDAKASGEADRQTAQARQSVARGQALFNARRFVVSGVSGLNDELGVAALSGTCTTCHDSPGAGNHSIPAPLNIGVADPARAGSGMPVYVLRNLATGERVSTTDPGRALLTGKWKDVGRFKGPVLRALASRAPYFHNGMAADLGAVVDFYNDRFSIGFTQREKDDLVAFLRTL